MRSEARAKRGPSHGSRDAGHARPAVRKLIEEYREVLTRKATEHPIGTVAIALGAGYLVGGGLISRFTARIVGAGLRIGLRVVALPIVSQQLVALGQDLLSRDDARPTTSNRGRG